MKYSIITVFLALLFITSATYAQNTLSHQTNSLRQDSVGKGSEDNIDFEKIAILSLPFSEDLVDSTLVIYNQDMSVYTYFEVDDIQGAYKCDSLNNKIFSYYPSWDIMIFFYEDSDNDFCKIRIGESWKLINKDYIYAVHDLDSFLCSSEYWSNQTDEFFKEDLITKIYPQNPSLKEYKILKRKKDWILIDNGKFRAWVKWKNGSYVLPDRLRFDI